MEHKGTKRIETERLILRPFRPGDAAAAYRNWTSDNKVTEFLRWQTHSDITVTETVIGNWVKESEKPDFYQWAIVLKEIGEPIGSIGVVDRNEFLDILHIGYCIGSRWWHRGITTEAFSAIIPYLFEEVGANRIESQHDPDNPHSGGVMKKCGLTYEGTLRQADFSNKGIVDACMYGILKSDWESKKQG
ncbi:MAG: GNAT family N-acetyltransferase [Lachnospiraceae bacterium]|nr:GNAT family N-acetyltransferase [Lachnospiraceae bacterium]